MSITFNSATTLAYSTSNPSANYPASVTRGDLLVLLVGTKPDTAQSTRPVGNFRYLGSYSGGGGSTAADAGPTRIEVFWKIATGTESGTESVSSPNNSVSWAQMYHYSNATGFWDLAIAGGTDSTPDASWSVTCDVDPGIIVDDWVLVGSCIPTDIGAAAQFSSELVAATGATFYTTTELSEPSSSLGNDIGGFVFHTVCLSGPASAPPTITASVSGTTTNVRGPSVLIRIREASSQREIDPFTLASAGTSLPLTDEVMDGLGGNGTGTWNYAGNQFGNELEYLPSAITCTTASIFSRHIILPVELTFCWFTMRFMFSSAFPTNNTTLMQIRAADGTTIRAAVELRTNQRVQCRNGSTSVGSGLGPISLDYPYYVSWRPSDGASQRLYLYDYDGALIDSEFVTYNQGSFSNFVFGIITNPGVATTLYISRPGYDTASEIPPTIITSDLGFLGIPMA